MVPFQNTSNRCFFLRTELRKTSVFPLQAWTHQEAYSISTSDLRPSLHGAKSSEQLLVTTSGCRYESSRFSLNCCVYELCVEGDLPSLGSSGQSGHDVGSQLLRQSVLLPLLKHIVCLAGVQRIFSPTQGNFTRYNVLHYENIVS